MVSHLSKYGIGNLLTITCKSSYCLRPNSGILLEVLKDKMLETLGKSAFQAAAQHLPCL